MLSFLWCRIFISDKECLRPRNMKLLLGFVCLFWVFLCLLAACEFFVTFFKLKKKRVLFFFLRRGFGMRSSFWYIVSGSITNTRKPLNSTGNCFRVIPSTYAALKTDWVCGNIWHISEKMPFVFSDLSF